MTNSARLFIVSSAICKFHYLCARARRLIYDFEVEEEDMIYRSKRAISTIASRVLRLAVAVTLKRYLHSPPPPRFIVKL